MNFLKNTDRKYAEHDVEQDELHTVLRRFGEMPENNQQFQALRSMSQMTHISDAVGK